MAAMAGLNRIWQNNTISFANKFKLYKSLVTPIVLYGCEIWTLLADSEKKDPCFRNEVPEEKLLRIFYLEAQDQRLGAEQNNFLVGSLEPLLATVKRRKLAWLGHITRHASPKPPFRAPWSVGDALVGRGNARWTTSKSGHPCPCQNC